MLALFTIVIPALAAALFCVFAIIMLRYLNDWWLPQQPSSTTPRYHYFTRFAKWTKNKLTAAVIAARKKLASALGNAVARTSHALVRLLDNVTEIVARTGDTIELEAKQTYQALYALRHVTMPSYVQGYVRPVITTANQALALAQGVSTTLTNVSTEFANGLRSLPWGVPIGLPARVATFWTTYKRLWDKVWDDVGPKVAQLWTQIVPELRQRIEALERGTSGGIGNAMQAIRNRLSALETWRENVVAPAFAAIGVALDALRARVTTLEQIVAGEVELGLAELWSRIEAIEAQIADVILPQLQALADAIQPLIDAGLAALLARIEDVELKVENLVEHVLPELAARVTAIEAQIANVLVPQLQALAARVDALADIVSGEVELALAPLFARLEAIEAHLRDVVDPLLDELRVGLIEIRTRIETDLLPRLEAIERALEPAALAALVLAALRVAAPNLFCNNVTRATSALCADDEDFWRDLLAGVLIFAIALNPREVAAAGQSLTGFLGGVIAETVDH